MAHTQKGVSADAVTVRLPRELVEQVRALAQEHERSLAGELRVALASYVKRQKGGE